ncbi:MAG TPA: hypothetical protein VNF75_08630 [Candidatus Dormibacteraeota bacterium]|nr:hypothetical protein [Candidatus Dormibacteraeota bacterium]
MFVNLAQEFSGDHRGTGPATVGGSACGSSELKGEGTQFAVLTSGDLVFELSAARVAALTMERSGSPFDGCGDGRPREGMG